MKLVRYLLLTILLITSSFCAVYWQNDIPLADLKDAYAPAPSKFIKLNDVLVHYRDEGNRADTTPIVLIHGTAASLHTWEAWANELKQKHRVIRMDLPAYGLTGPNTSGDYSPEYYAQFMHHFLQKLGVKKCIIAGNSLGGAIAWRYTLRYPTAVSKLVLIDAVGYPMEAKSVPVAFQLAGMPVLKNLFQYVTPRFIVQNSIENVYADKTKVEPALVDRYFNLALRAGNRQAFIERMSIFKTLLNDSTYLQIKTIKTPTLILWGDKDLLIPVTVAENFHADLPNDTLVVLKNLGHTPMEEDPKQTLEVFKSFLIKK
ncbi:MAG: alpha/beta hydrolase [Sphingobacteriales bacterium]|nr:alpha/beta hydrolase [Sphingobacteriales bacterium]